MALECYDSNDVTEHADNTFNFELGGKHKHLYCTYGLALERLAGDKKFVRFMTDPDKPYIVYFKFEEKQTYKSWLRITTSKKFNINAFVTSRGLRVDTLLGKMFLFSLDESTGVYSFDTSKPMHKEPGANHR